MTSWEPVDIDRDGTGDKDYKWGDDLMNDLEMRFNQLRQFSKTLDKSRDENHIDITTNNKNALKCDTIELVANQMYDKLTIMFNNDRIRFGIQEGAPILEPLRKHNNFKIADDGALTYVYKKTVINLDNTNEKLKAPWEMCRLDVTKLKYMGFTNIIDKDINPYKPKYIKTREKLRKLDDNLDERSTAVESSSTTGAETTEMIEMTSKDIDNTIKGVEQEALFIEPGERDKLLPLRELEGLDKQLRTIKGSLKVAIAKGVDLKARTEHDERKLGEVQNPTYSDDQRDMTEDRIKRLRAELDERNKEIDILKYEASKQINQIKESITKFLDKEMGTLGERIRTLFKEHGITIVPILTAVCMAIGVLIEALLGNPTVCTTSSSTSGGDGKGDGAREWIKNKLKALLQLLGKLADEALASLPGIIGSILSWILNRAKEVIGWLSQNLWALITGVGVLICTYFVTKTRRR